MVGMHERGREPCHRGGQRPLRRDSKKATSIMLLKKLRRLKSFVLVRAEKHVIDAAGGRSDQRLAASI